MIPVSSSPRTQYALAASTVLVATLLSWPVRHVLAHSDLIMIHLAAVALVSWRLPRGPSLASAVLAVASFDFFYVPPQFTFAVEHGQYLLTFAMMAATGLLLSGLMSRFRTQATVAEERERRTAALYDLARDLDERLAPPDIARRTADAIGRFLGGEGVVRLSDGATSLAPSGDAGADPDPADDQAARHAFLGRVPTGAFTDRYPAARGRYLPLQGADRVFGVLGVVPRDREVLADPENRRLLAAFVSQAGLAMERGALDAEAQQAQLEVEAERLRSSLLSSVSHDLKTPVSSIMGSSSVLLSSPGLDEATRAELSRSIFVEADRLHRLLQNLLEMTRIESGAVKVDADWQLPEEVIGAALHRLDEALSARPVHVDIDPDVGWARFDPLLIELVLGNLLENAIKYTPEDAAIRVGVRRRGDVVELSVADEGEGLPPGSLEQVFEKFHRGSTPARVPGAGLGLSICRGLVEAHGGRIRAESPPEGGARFVLALPSPRGGPDVVPAAEEEVA